MSSKVKTGFVVALILALVTSAIAGVMLSRPIPTTMRIKKAVSMAVFDVDGSTELTFIQLGDFLWNTGKTFPLTYPTQTYFVNNTDQMDLYLSFTVENLPAGISFIMNLKRGDQSDWRELPQGVIYEYPIISPSLNPGQHEKTFCYLTFRVWVNQPAFGDFSPMIYVHAHDTPSG